MPYIDQQFRYVLKPRCIPAKTEGDLNYQISVLLNRYMEHHGLSYNRMGDCTSACENAAAEFRRRVMAPYEDQKILDNGDVYSDIVIPQPPF